jgi:hypothetical protein
MLNNNIRASVVMLTCGFLFVQSTSKHTTNMPHQYSTNKYADIHFIYGFCYGNLTAAVAEYG